MKELFNTLSNVSQFFREKRFVYIRPGGAEGPKGNVQSSDVKTDKPKGKPTAERSDKTVHATEDAGDLAEAEATKALKIMQEGLDSVKKIMKGISNSRENLTKQGTSTEALLAFDKCVQRTAYLRLAEKTLGKKIDFQKTTGEEWQKVADDLLTKVDPFILSYTEKYPNKIPSVYSNPKTTAAKKSMSHFLHRSDNSLRSALKKNDDTSKDIKKDISDSRDLLVLDNASKEVLFIFDKCMNNPAYTKLLARKFKPMNHKLSTPQDWQGAADYLLTHMDSVIISYTEKYPNDIPKVFNPPKTAAAKKFLPVFTRRSSSSISSILRKNNNTVKEMKKEMLRARDLLTMGEASAETLLVFDRCMENPAYMRLLARKFKPMHHKLSTMQDWQDAADYLLTHTTSFMLLYAQKNPKDLPSILENPKTPKQKQARVAIENWQKQYLSRMDKKINNS